MTTGITRPSISLPEVLALKALQKSMILTPCCPKAGPTGGAGVAFPAGICNLTCPATFLLLDGATAISDSSSLLPKTHFRTPLQLLHLQEIQFDRRRTAENGDHHFQ